MKTGLARIEEAYTSNFQEYLRGKDEQALRAAYELGREAVREQLSVLELAAIHHTVLASVLEDCGRPVDPQQVTRAASEFFLESLSAFEMVQRGFWEATQTARLEREHVTELRELAQASVGLNSTLSVGGILQVLVDQSRALMGAKKAVAQVTGQLPDAPPAMAVSGSDGPASDGPSSSGAESPGPEAGDVLAAPLIGRGDRIVGTIQLFGKEHGAFSDRDQSILRQLAQTASVAVQNAQLYERERRIAETLQRSLLPAVLPAIPGVELAIRFHPGPGVEVGGDFYDAFAIEAGAFGLVVGDVCGKGVEAAAVTSLARYTIRAVAMRQEDPSEVLKRLNETMLRSSVERFCTVLYGILRVADGGARFALARGGHIPPAVLRASGEVERVESAGALVGVFPDPQFEDRVVDLRQGDALVMCTDGATERSSIGGEQGWESLIGTCAGLTAEAIAERLDEALVGEDGRPFQDDVAMMILRVRPT